MDADAGLTFTVERRGRAAIVVAAGEFEFATAAELRETLLALADDGTRDVTLDLSAIEFIDSTGISLLVQSKQRYEERGGRFALRSPARRVVRVLDVAGLAGAFTVEGDAG